MNALAETLANRGLEIRRLRLEAGLSQAQLARAVGSSQQTIDRIERRAVTWSRTTEPALQLLRSILGPDEPAQSPAPPQPRPAVRTDDVAVRGQAEIKVHRTPCGSILITETDDGPEGDDQTVMVHAENADALVAAILRAKAEILGL